MDDRPHLRAAVEAGTASCLRASVPASRERAFATLNELQRFSAG